jgi:cytochrome P450
LARPNEDFNLLRSQPLAFLQSVATDGPLAKKRIGQRNLIVALSPATIREVLVTRQRELVKTNIIDVRQHRNAIRRHGLLASNGPDQHERGKRLLRPAFSSDEIRVSVGPIAEDEANQLIARWQIHRQVNLRAELIATSLAIASRALFGVSIDASTNVVADICRTLDSFRLVNSYVSMVNDAMQVVEGFKFIRAEERLDLLAATLIRGSGSVAKALRDTDLSDRERMSEAKGILFAATETTSSALTWALVELSRDSSLGDRIATYGTTAADNIFAETLRMYPPAWYIGRSAAVETRLAGEIVPEGTMVLVSPYLLHRSHEHFSEPDTFDPQRWEQGLTAATRAFTYIPFGAGPRRCIGEEIAWLEARILLTAIARKFEIELVGNPDLALLPGASLHPKGKVVAQLRPR